MERQDEIQVRPLVARIRGGLMTTDGFPPRNTVYVNRHFDNIIAGAFVVAFSYSSSPSRSF